MKKSSNDPSQNAGDSSNRVSHSSGDFAFRLYDMIQDCSSNSPQIAKWESDGGFSIFNSEKLQETYFAKYQFLNKSTQFVTTFASFHRQLNLYGFSIEGTKVQHKQGLFHQGRIDLLSQINRRQTSKRYLPPPPPSVSMGNRPSEVESSSSSTSASTVRDTTPSERPVTPSTRTAESSVNAVVVSTLSRLATETSELRVVVLNQTNRILSKLGHDDKTRSKNNIADSSPMISVSAASASSMHSPSTPSPPSPPLGTQSDPAKLLALHMSPPASSGILPGSIAEGGPQPTGGEVFRSEEKHGMPSSSFANRSYAFSSSTSRMHGTWSRSSKQSLASTASGNTTAGITAGSDILEGNPLSDAASFSTSSGEMLFADDIEKVFDSMPAPDESGEAQASHPYEHQTQVSTPKRGASVRPSTSPTLSHFQFPRRQGDKNPRPSKRTRETSKSEAPADNADVKQATTNNNSNASGRIVWGGVCTTKNHWDEEATAEEDETAEWNGNGNGTRRGQDREKRRLEQRCSRCGTRELLSAALVLLVLTVALQVLDVVMTMDVASSATGAVSNTYNSYFGNNDTSSVAVVMKNHTTDSPPSPSLPPPSFSPSSLSPRGVTEPISPGPTSFAPSPAPTLSPSFPDPTTLPSSLPPSIAPTLSGPFDRVVSVVKDAMSRIVPPGEWDETYMLDGYDQWGSQYSAAKWLAHDDPQKVDTRRSQTVLERFALATFFFATAGHSNAYFIEGDTVKEDTGERVDIDDDVNLMSFQFGEERILDIRRVATLRVSWRKRHNFLSENDVCHWQARVWKGVYCATEDLGVTRLDLGQNNLVGTIPSELALLTNLSSIVLRRNKLTGWIPTLLSSLAEVRVVHLSQNELTGSLPPSLVSRWKKLEVLHLKQNNLAGTLPDSLGRLLRLRSIDLSFNNFTMTIPESFANLRRLEKIDLASNDLNGTIPGFFQHLTHLRFIFLSRNGFDGSIPNGFLDSLKVLRRFSVAGNSLTGRLPIPAQPLLPLVTFKVSANNFFGTIPEVLFERLPNVRWLELANNHLSGTLPSNINVAAKLERLRLTGNYLSGTLPEILAHLTQLRHLVARENRLSGSLPDIFDRMPLLEEVALGYNQLTGTIPLSVGTLTSLELFSCDNNTLAGTLPSVLGQLKSLRRLNLSNNTLKGGIPSTFSGLESLVALFLGGNQLNSTIPSELGDLKNLEALELESNDFTGTVPPSFLLLKNLRTLSLQQNRITGNITFLCQLPALQKIKADCEPQSGGSPPPVVCDCCLRCNRD